MHTDIQYIHSTRITTSDLEIQHHRYSRLHSKLYCGACMPRAAAELANGSTYGKVLPMALYVRESISPFHLYRSCSDHQVR